MLRSTWDYPPRRDEFVAWAHAVKRLANPAAVVEWNTDKRYLASLGGIPVVPTVFVTPSDTWSPPPGQYVIKRAIEPQRGHGGAVHLLVRYCSRSTPCCSG